MDASVVVLSVVVLLFAVASAVLGFIAESKTLTPDDINYAGGVCVYPAKPAYMLGIRAVALLAAAQIIASAASLCCVCFNPRAGGATGPKLKKAASSIVLSWIFAVAAAVSYAQGVSWNAATTRRPVVDGFGLFISCEYLSGAVFVRAALLGLAAAVLGVCAYAILREQSAGEEPPKPDGQQPVVGGAQNAQQQVAPLPQVQAHAQV
ncbi:unnamed protein product [Urochloa decumbens]|uniref:Uncharacterized protein n=1 Tax=Urochloa decumbens TaxID=240449 RepID=A0ABC9GIZ1_9POAL